MGEDSVCMVEVVIQCCEGGNGGRQCCVPRRVGDGAVRVVGVW